MQSHDICVYILHDCHSVHSESDLIHLNVFGTHILVVNSAEVAKALFEGKSALYGDRLVYIFTWSSENSDCFQKLLARPRMTMLNELYVESLLLLR